MAKKTNWQYEMLAAFICVLLTKDWAILCAQYRCMKDKGRVAYLHINYDTNASPYATVNNDDRYQLDGTCVIRLNDEHFDPTIEVRMHLAYLLVDSMR